MKGVKDHIGSIIVISVTLLCIFNVILWNIETKLFFSEDVIIERLIGTTFVDKSDDDNCVIVTNKNIKSLDYTLSPHFNMAIGIPGDNHICKVKFHMIVNNGNADYNVNGTLVLRYDSSDGRKWICERLYSNEYETHHVNWYSFK